MAGLNTPGILDLTLVVQPPSGPTAETPIGKHPFTTETDTVDLPPGFPWNTVGTDGGPLRFAADLYECGTFMSFHKLIQ